MAKAAKRSQKARNQLWRVCPFATFEAPLSRLGLRSKLAHGREGSHRLWYSPKGYRLPVQPAKDARQSDIRSSSSSMR